MANQRELNLILRLKDRVSGELKNVAGKMNNVGKQMQGVGRTMTRGLTLPIVGAGAAAFKFSTDFDDAAKQVASTANLTTDEVGRLKEGVDEVATSTGQASDEIFSAMQKAVSGSLDLAESQKLVEQTTKAAAAGFGENERLIDVTTTAYDLFNDQVESADQILDNLVRGAQSTQVNVEDMAGAFSRVASIGAGMNLQNEELVASLGVVAERMGDTQRAGRAFTQMLSSLQKPSGEAEAVILDIFGSMDNLNNSMQDDLIGTLAKLRDGLEASDGKLADVFTTTQSLDAANLLLADSGQRASDVLVEVQNSAGAVNDAFAKSESTQRALNRLWQETQSAGRKIGEVLNEFLVPIINKLIGFIQRASDWFSNLSESQQKLIIIAFGVVAALGPILTVFGTFLTMLPLMAKGFGMLFGVFGKVITIAKSLGTALMFLTTNPIGLTITAVAALVTAGILLVKNWDKVKKWLKDTWEGIKLIFNSAIESIMQKLQPMIDAVKRVKQIGKNVGGAIGGFVKGVIPGLAEGGIVRQPTLAMVGEAGPEAVVPLDKAGGMGSVTVNINGGFYLDRNAGEELADAIGEELRRRLRL